MVDVLIRRGTLVLLVVLLLGGIPAAAFMQALYPARLLSFEHPFVQSAESPVKDDPDYIAFEVLRYLTLKPPSRVLAFGAPDIAAFTQWTVVNYFDDAVAGLFNPKLVPTVEDLMNELESLGITHVYKGTGYTAPMIYRTVMNDVLSDPSYSSPVVFNKSSILYELRTGESMQDALSCAAVDLEMWRSVPLYRLSVPGVVQGLFESRSRVLHADRQYWLGPRLERDRVMVYGTLARGNLPPDGVIPPERATAARVQITVRGTGLFVLQVDRLVTAGSSDYLELETVGIATAREVDGVVRLSGQVQLQSSRFPIALRLVMLAGHVPGESAVVTGGTICFYGT